MKRGLVFGFLIILLGIFLTNSIVSGINEDLVIDIPNTNGDAFSHKLPIPAVSDLNSDGLQEIFVVKSDGKLYGFDAFERLLENFPVDLVKLAGFDKVSTTGNTPSIADIDQDGKQDIVAGVVHSGSLGTKIFVINFQGKVIPTWPQQGLSIGFSNPSPVICDLDSDGNYEILTIGKSTEKGNFNGYLYVLKKDGTTFNSHFPLTFLDLGIQPSPPSCADLDGDINKEIIVLGGSSKMGLNVIRSQDASYIWTKEVKTYRTSLAVGDIDQNNKLDIVVTEDRGIKFNDPMRVSIFDAQGNYLPNWPQFFYDASYITSPTLADLNHDGYLEIIFGTSDSSTNKFYLWAYNYDGTPYQKNGFVWPKEIFPEVSLDYDVNPIVGDVDGDGEEDILFLSSFDSVYLFGFDQNGLNLEGFPKDFTLQLPGYSTNTLGGKALISDLQGDGDREVIASVFFNTCLNCPSSEYFSRISSFDMGKISKISDSWPTFQQNNYRTGVLESSQKIFIRGDTDRNNKVDLTDAVFILNWLFKGGETPKCLDAADADDNGQVGITDAIRILSFLFKGGASPELPYPEAGTDPTEDELNCLA